MTSTRLLAALPLIAPMMVLAACVPSAPAPTPAPRPAQPAPEPVQAPPPPAAPALESWMDAPQTPGDWYYATTADGSIARFGSSQGEARFSVVCHRPQASVSLVRSGSSPVAVPMQVRTETADRVFSAQPQAGQLPGLAASLPARDSFLDAIAFSKGRFAVEIAGVPPLYLPAWPEIGRVIDDCR